MNTTLQVPITKKLKIQGKKYAKESGFSSLQEFVRFLITNSIKGNVSIHIEPTLSAEAIERIEKDIEETEKGIKDGTVPVHKTAEDAIEYLKSV